MSNKQQSDLKEISVQYNEFRYNNRSNKERDTIISFLKSLNPKLVIDAGCGNNIYKNVVPNLIGFDLGYFKNADFRSSILDAEFQKESADAILALGSIQFIDREYIIQNIKKILSWVKPGGYIIMRVRNKTPEMVKYLESNKNPMHQVPWSIDFVQEVTKMLDLKFEKEPIIKDVFRDCIRTERIFWIWKK